MQLLNRIIPVYRCYTNEYGLPDVRARTWHPGWFIPVWKYQIIYWLGFWKRYKSYQETLSFVYAFLINLPEESDEDILENIKILIRRDVDCGFECDYTEPYEFVPEADCPIHNI